MEIRLFAERILFGNTLEDKLCPLDQYQDEAPGRALEVPAAPGRPAALALDQYHQRQRVRFAELRHFHTEKERGLVLHFFANHELLALELLALALLRFPTAPDKFRRGLVQILKDEQEHVRLYLERLAQVGVEFGQIPVSDFFWRAIAPSPSPLDFVARLSLTLEQAKRYNVLVVTGLGNGNADMSLTDKNKASIDVIRRFLRATLTGQGYRLVEAPTGADGRVEVGSRQPDVVIIDLGLPDMDGIEVIRRLREWTAVPIIVLSARGQERDKVTALDAGADDYVSKPFGASELLARIRVAIRHTAGASHEADEAAFRVGELEVDLLRRQVAVGGADIRLTPTEYKLLTTLIRNAGKVVTHQQLLREVWGPAHTDQAHYVRIYMAHLRHKLEAEPARPRYLLTEPGVGYRLAVD